MQNAIFCVAMLRRTAASLVHRAARRLGAYSTSSTSSTSNTTANSKVIWSSVVSIGVALCGSAWINKRQDDALQELKEQIRLVEQHNKDLDEKLLTRQQVIQQAQDVFARAMKQEYADASNVRYPYYMKHALEDGIRNTLKLTSTQSGVVVVAAPEGSGKTSSIRCVCRSLVDAEVIRGAFIFDCAKQPKDVHRAFWKSLGVNPDNANACLQLAQVMPPRPMFMAHQKVVVVLDNIDEADKADPASLMRLCRELMSSSTNYMSFVVLVTCKDASTAKKVLELDSHKVWLLGVDGKAVNGNPNTPADTWLRRGLKWTRDDCEQLVAEYTAVADLVRLEEFRLHADVHRKLIDLATKAGTPGFIWDFYKVLHNPEKSTAELLELLDSDFSQRATQLEQQWHQIAEIKAFVG